MSFDSTSIPQIQDNSTTNVNAITINLMQTCVSSDI